MVMTRCRNGSRNPSRGGSPVRSGGSPVRYGDDDDRSPSPLPHFSRGRMQTPSAAVSLGGAASTKSAAKTDTLPVVGL